ncbi:MAG: ribonuclease P protein component [Sphingomonadaceae bacterium]
MDAAPPRPVADKAESAPRPDGAGAPARLRKRRDFIAANRGVRVVTPAFTLLVHPNHSTAGATAPRVGFTVSRKVGNAVARNRARRRLREMARLALGPVAIPGADHVFIARPQDAERPFDTLVSDMRAAMDKARKRLQANG